MDRLTYRIASGATNLIGIIEANGPFEKAKLRQAGWERLADYEDTGLEPSDYSKMFVQLLKYKDLGTPEQIAAAMAELEELKNKSCGAYPTSDPNIKPKCFYQEANNNFWCGALGHGENDDEPIEACQKCCHCEFNTLSEEAKKNERT